MSLIAAVILPHMYAFTEGSKANFTGTVHQLAFGLITDFHISLVATFSIESKANIAKAKASFLQIS